MNESEFAKKESEEHDVALFLKVYERITGLKLAVTSRRERPDFQVQRGSETFGLELVQVMERPGTRDFRVMLGGGEDMWVSDVSDAVQEAIYRKDEKRQSPGWGHAGATILVVHLKGASVADLWEYWDAQILEEIRASGFHEIWICDHSPEESFGEVDLACVKPAKWEGVHRGSRPGGKPFG